MTPTRSLFLVGLAVVLCTAATSPVAAEDTELFLTLGAAARRTHAPLHMQDLEGYDESAAVTFSAGGRYLSDLGPGLVLRLHSTRDIDGAFDTMRFRSLGMDVGYAHRLRFGPGLRFASTTALGLGGGIADGTGVGGPALEMNDLHHRVLGPFVETELSMDLGQVVLGAGVSYRAQRVPARPDIVHHYVGATLTLGVQFGPRTE